MSPTYLCYVGVDIAAKTFTATWAADPASAPKASTFDQTDVGFAHFQQALAASGVAPSATLVARCAAARKLLTLAWALVKKNQSYRAPVAAPPAQRAA